MIKSFAQSWLEEFWHSGKSKRVPSELTAQTLRKMDMLNRAKELKDISSPPSNHLHRLHGDREGQWAISVNGPWRLCFYFKDGEVSDLELTQYH
ncbi:MAG: type II toxin-antitoxin system RelE/ParE family toxin [Pseudomonadota bacterium]